MKRTTIILVFSLFWLTVAFAQEKEATVSSGTYSELPNPAPADPGLWKGRHGVRVSWGSTDVRYEKERPVPVAESRTKIELGAWRGERVAAQWVASVYDPVTLSYTVSDLIHTRDKTQKIGRSRVLAGMVRYVMTDELNKDGKGGCGYRRSTDFDSSLAADVIDQWTPSLAVPARHTQAGWVRVWVPADAVPGRYAGTVTILGNGQAIGKLDLMVEVGDRLLPEPRSWSFHLDLWQNPYAVARYYQVEPWSEAHFAHLRQEMKLYAEAGGDVITASIIHKPWNGQTYDYFETMVTWLKKADGSWYFDYTIFDRWVELMMELGVDRQINCYSMIPWRLSFQYYDQATNRLRHMEAKPGEPAYEEFWVAMLKSFADHLKRKGWFEKTRIAMDERPMEAMMETLKVIRKADKHFKVALAGNLHPELSDDIEDYCIPYGQNFSPELLSRRKAAGRVSTFYTSCSQPYPNTFTFSPPAESEWLGWYAAARNLDGFLRWAYNSWVRQPLLDSRFTTWAAGDTYLVYPGGRSSIRFERLVEGIQQYEKIRILKQVLSEKGDRKGLQKLDKALAGFDRPEAAAGPPAAALIREAKKVLQGL